MIGATFSEEYLEQQRITERQKRLAAHKGRLAAQRAGNSLIAISRMSKGAFLRSGSGAACAAIDERGDAEAQGGGDEATGGGGSGSTAGAARKPKGSLFRAMSRSSSALSVAPAKVSRRPPPAVPGYIECEWLLDEYRRAIAGDVRAIMQKGEEDLMRMARKAIIHSRIIAPGTARAGEQGPGGHVPLSADLAPRGFPGWQREATYNQMPSRRVRRA